MKEQAKQASHTYTNSTCTGRVSGAHCRTAMLVTRVGPEGVIVRENRLIVT